MRRLVRTQGGLREVEAHESGVPGLFVIEATEAPGLFALSHSSGVGFSDTRFESVHQARRAAYLLRNIDWSKTIADLAADNDLDVTLHGIHSWVNGIHIQRSDTSDVPCDDTKANDWARREAGMVRGESPRRRVVALMKHPLRGSTPRLAIEVIMNFQHRVLELPADNIDAANMRSAAAMIAAEADAEIERLQRVIAERDKIADRLGEKRREAEAAAEKAKVKARAQRDERMATLVKLREAMQEIERMRFPR